MFVTYDKYFRNALYKVWKKALLLEVPLLVETSSVWNELKPEVKFIEIMQTPGGFIAGRYEIIFKRPHWDNTHKFIEVMELLTQEYRLRPEEEGVFGRTFEGYVKHVYQVRDKKGNIENY